MNLVYISLLSSCETILLKLIKLELIPGNNQY